MTKEHRPLLRVFLDGLIWLAKEAGMLIIAFTPLEIVLANDDTLNPKFVVILKWGIAALVLGLFFEWLVGFLDSGSQTPKGP